MENITNVVETGIPAGKEKHLNKVFTLIKKTENLAIVDRKTQLSGTEIRMLGEIITAKYEGKRLISTQLAKMMGLTRSAISQIVNRLEARDVVRRVSSTKDKKIAYIEITDTALEIYKNDLNAYVDFVDRVVEKFGEEKFATMCGMFDEFYGLIDEEKADFVQKRKYRKGK